MAHWLMDYYLRMRLIDGVVGVAVANNHFELAKWLVTRVGEDEAYVLWQLLRRMETWKYSSGCALLSKNVDLKEAWKAAMRFCHLQLVKWILQQPGVISRDLDFLLDSAYSNGHVDLLEWVI